MFVNRVQESIKESHTQIQDNLGKWEKGRIYLLLAFHNSKNIVSSVLHVVYGRTCTLHIWKNKSLIRILILSTFLWLFTISLKSYYILMKWMFSFLLFPFCHTRALHNHIPEKLKVMFCSFLGYFSSELVLLLCLGLIKKDPGYKWTIKSVFGCLYLDQPFTNCVSIQFTILICRHTKCDCMKGKHIKIKTL